MDDNKKKLIGISALVVVAIGAVIFSMTRSGIMGEQGESIGSLEEGVNKASGLPLNPPPNDAASQGAGGAGSDPSLPGGN